MSRAMLVAALVALLSISSHGHMGLTPSEAPVNEDVIVSLRISHDCGDETVGTSNFTVVLPPEVKYASVEQIPNWRVMIHMSDPEGHDDMMKGKKKKKGKKGSMMQHSTIRAVTYLGFLPDGFYQLFNLRVRMPSKAGETIWFKGYQDCHNQGTSVAWDQIPSKKDPFPQYPAKGIKMVKAKMGSHMH